MRRSKRSGGPTGGIGDDEEGVLIASAGCSRVKSAPAAIEHPLGISADDGYEFAFGRGRPVR